MSKWLGKFKETAQEGTAEPTLPLIDFQLEGKKAAELMARQGWVAIRSHALGGETVLFVQSDKVQVPAEYNGCARYTTDELRALCAEPKPDPEFLRKIHQAKKLFNGTIKEGGNTKWKSD